MALDKKQFTRMSPELVRTLEMTKKKYATDFLDIYQAFIGYHMAGEARNQLERARDNIKVAIESITKLLDFSEVVTPARIKNLDALMETVEKDFVEFSKLFNIAPEDQEIMDRVLEKRGLSLTKLSEQQKIIRSRIQKVSKPSTTQLSGMWKGVPSVVQDIGKGALSGMLGPFGGIAEAAYGVGKNVLDRREEKRAVDERENFVSATLSQDDTSFKTFASSLNNLNRAGAVPRFVEQGRGEKSSSSRSNTSSNGIAELLGLRSPQKGRNELNNKYSGAEMSDAVSDGLKKFFNADYKYAKWTKDIYDVLVDPSVRKKERLAQGADESDSAVKSFFQLASIFKDVGKVFNGVTAGLSGILGRLVGPKALGSLGRVLTAGAGTAAAGGALGTAAAVGVAGLAGWSAGRYLGEHTGWDGKSTDEHAQDFWSNTLFAGQHRKAQEMNLASNITDPQTRRRIQLMNEGYTSQEAWKILQTTPVPIESGSLQVPIVPPSNNTNTTKPVPIDVSDVQDTQDTLMQLSKINQNLQDIKETNDKAQSRTSSIMQSGYDAYNLRDPLLSALNTGTLDLN